MKVNLCRKAFFVATGFLGQWQRRDIKVELDEAFLPGWAYPVLPATMFADLCVISLRTSVTGNEDWICCIADTNDANCID
jgi:hypothetical protein